MEKQEHVYESLKLENQVCFPLYACSKEIIRKYKPFLEEIDLTYTQYIVMMVLWEKKNLNVKELGDYVYLDSGTLTPLLKKLAAKGYITRVRDNLDERKLSVSLTQEGLDLRDRALEVPRKMIECVTLEPQEMRQLYSLLYKALGSLRD